MITLAARGLLLVLALMTGLWGLSVWKRDVSIVDPWWSISFLLITTHAVLATGLTPGKALLTLMVALWALRLWLYLLLRARGAPEDPRYAAFRQRFGPERYWWFSLFQVFWLQGALAFLISAPLFWAAAAGAPDPISWTDALGAVLFVTGFGFEVVADAQLARFRRDPSRRGSVLDQGLWRYSRHPNYFGEALLWWGFGLTAFDRPWGFVTLLGPALMTFLLLRVSGVTMLDAQLTRSKPGYAEYVRRTSAFIPRRPRA